MGKIEMRHMGQMQGHQGAHQREVVSMRDQMQMKRRESGGPQLPSFCQGWAGVFICDSDLGRQSRLCREESKMGKKVNKKSKVVLLATDRTASYSKKGVSSE